MIITIDEQDLENKFSILLKLITISACAFSSSCVPQPPWVEYDVKRSVHDPHLYSRARCGWYLWNPDPINRGMVSANQPLTNYLSFFGYRNDNGDGSVTEVEEVDTSFNLEDIHCSGKSSLLIVISSVHCIFCPESLSALRWEMGRIRDADGVVLGIVSGVDATETAQLYSKERHGLDVSYVGTEDNVTGDIPSILDDGSRSYPEAWVIDLESMRIVVRRREAAHLVAAVEAAADD